MRNRQAKVTLFTDKHLQIGQNHKLFLPLLIGWIVLHANCIKITCPRCTYQYCHTRSHDLDSPINNALTKNMIVSSNCSFIIYNSGKKVKNLYICNAIYHSFLFSSHFSFLFSSHFSFSSHIQVLIK